MVTVALDIGHGSNTFPPGKGIYKGGKGYAEHDFNSKLVTAIDKQLKANGIKTIIYQKPHTKDIRLTTRTNYYNAKKVDLVYSIHANYNSSSAVNGRCVFYWHTAKDSKKMADLVVDEIKKAGYSTHGGGYHASKPGSWTNLHICRETNMTAVLVENGFMSGSQDFDLVFGSKQNEYIADMAVVHAKAICRYFGISYNGKKPKPSKSTKKSTKKANKSKSISRMVQEVNDGKHGNGHTNRRNSLGISKAKYKKVRAEVNRNAGLSSTSKSKSVSQMASEVSAGKHGNGHAHRRKSLGISKAEYKKVRAYVNKGAGVSTTSKSKSISQMAQEIDEGKHGNGHANRRKSLGVSKSTYAKVRDEVNRGAGVKTSKPKTSYSVGNTVTLKNSASKFATGQSILNSAKGKKYKIIQTKSDRVLLDVIMSWVKKSDIY